MLSLFTTMTPLPLRSLRTWLVTSIQRLPTPQSAFTTCQPPPFCARAEVENKQEAASRQNKGRYIMRFFIGGAYPIYREIEQPRAGPIQRQGYLSLVRFGTIQFQSFSLLLARSGLRIYLISLQFELT